MSDLTARIAEAIGDHQEMVCWEGDGKVERGECLECNHTDSYVDHLASKIAAVVYVRVDTDEQLKEVHPQSVILDADGDVYAMNEYGHAVLLTNYQGHPYEPPALPAIVLWSP
ncbi:hypothetical protein [Mycobacteroides abscessus]